MSFAADFLPRIVVFTRPRSAVLLRFQFFLQQYSACRPVEATILGVVACAAAASLIFWWTALTGVEASKTKLSGMHASSERKVRPLPVPAGVPQLPLFNSAELATQFHENAQVTGLIGEEVGYALEASAGQPYQRYRIRFPVKADYGKIRRFVAAVGADMPHLTLDGIHCTRENTAAAALACDLNFSAFFRLDQNG